MIPLGGTTSPNLPTVSCTIVEDGGVTRNVALVSKNLVFTIGHKRLHRLVVQAGLSGASRRRAIQPNASLAIAQASPSLVVAGEAVGAGSRASAGEGDTTAMADDAILGPARAQHGLTHCLGSRDHLLGTAREHLSSSSIAGRAPSQASLTRLGACAIVGDAIAHGHVIQAREWFANGRSALQRGGAGDGIHTASPLLQSLGGRECVAARTIHAASLAEFLATAIAGEAHPRRQGIPVGKVLGHTDGVHVGMVPLT